MLKSKLLNTPLLYYCYCYCNKQVLSVTITYSFTL